MEVHTGTRPGRPVRALLVVSVAFGLMGALAMVQVRAARGLQDEIVLADAPLAFRPPAGWQPLNDERSQWCLPAADGVRRRGLPYTKFITLSFQRRPAFIMPELPDRGRPTEMAGLPAVEFDQPGVIVMGRTPIECDGVKRLALTPRGDLLAIHLVTVTGMSTGDRDLLARVGATVRLSEPAPTAAALQAALGLELALDDTWRLQDAAHPQVAGGYVSAAVDGQPGWALSIHRTWLAFDRSAEQILFDCADRHWDRRPEQVVLQRHARADGVEVLRLTNPSDATPIPSGLWLVVASADEAALLALYAIGDDVRAAGRAAAEKLADKLAFAQTPHLPDLTTAGAAGAELARELARRGAAPWWGAQPHGEYLLANTAAGWRVWGVERRPRDKGPAHGYLGAELHHFPGGHRIDRWASAGAEGSYEVVARVYERDNLQRLKLAWETTETGGGPGDEIRRERGGDNGPRVETFPAAPNYVSPPLAILAAGLVAQRGAEPCLLTTSVQRGTGQYAHLARPLPVDGAGRARVLVQADYDPRPVVMTFDATGRLLRLDLSGAVYESASRDEIRRRFPKLLDLWRDLLGQPADRAHLSGQSGAA